MDPRIKGDNCDPTGSEAPHRTLHDPGLNVRSESIRAPCSTLARRIGYAHKAKVVHMNSTFNTQAAKKATNVSINSDLLAKARELKINLSATLEEALAERVNASQRERWKRENQAAIEAYNNLVEAQGTFSDTLRGF